MRYKVKDNAIGGTRSRQRMNKKSITQEISFFKDEGSEHTGKVMHRSGR